MNLFFRRSFSFIVLVLFAFVNMSDAKIIPEYVLTQKEIYVDEIMNEFIKEAEKEFDITAISTGGGVNPKVNEIYVRFYFDRQVNINEARWLLVYLTQQLADKVNQHEKIRPFLQEFPFPKMRGAKISLCFKENPNQKIKNVEFVHTGRDKIFYCKMPPPESFEGEDLLVEPCKDAIKNYKVEDKPKIFKKII